MTAGAPRLTHEKRAAVAVAFIGVMMNTWHVRRGDAWVLDRLAEYRGGQAGEYAQALSNQRIRRRDPLWGTEIEQAGAQTEP